MSRGRVHGKEIKTVALEKQFQNEWASAESLQPLKEAQEREARVAQPDDNDQILLEMASSAGLSATWTPSRTSSSNEFKSHTSRRTQKRSNNRK